MSRVYLTVEQVVEVHAAAIDRFGGTSNILDKPALESALGRFRSGYDSDLFEEAAALLKAALQTTHSLKETSEQPSLPLIPS